jgi:hypothetical protein
LIGKFRQLLYNQTSNTVSYTQFQDRINSLPGIS